MKPSRRARREAKQLFHFCVVNGSLDEQRAREVVRRLLGTPRLRTLAIASGFQRLVRLDRMKHHADVQSAAPLPREVREDLAARVTRVYGPDIVTSFAEDPALLGGVRVTVGSDMYDGTIKARLAAIEARF